jgi:RNA polymerase sigma-70 factor (ECF subfamily)
MQNTTLAVHRGDIEFSERQRSYVFSVAMRFMKDDDAAADVTQDALLFAYKNLDRFRGQSKFTTWLYRIAQNTSLVHLRKARSRAAKAGILADSLEPVANDPNPEELHSLREQLSIARRRLDQLGDDYGRVFDLACTSGYSYKEIGRQLDLPANTVKTRAYRARLAMRHALAKAG